MYEGCRCSYTINVTLYRSSEETNVRTDLKTTVYLLDKLKSRKKLDYKIVDTAKMSDSQLFEAYSKAIMPSVFNKYKVRKVFGTNRHSSIFFGKQQPGLLVEGDIWNVYPHEKDGKKIAIETFLTNLLKAV